MPTRFLSTLKEAARLLRESVVAEAINVEEINAARRAGNERNNQVDFQIMKITSLTTSPQQQVSHNPAIKKQVLIAGGEISGITQFARAIFPPGEIAPIHHHRDMTEVFFIESGRAEMEVNGQCVELSAGSCITIEPGENHELRNIGDGEMAVIYFGVHLNR